jgi:flagellar protein FlaJ
MKTEKKQFIGIIFAVIVVTLSAIFINKIGEKLFYFILVISLVIASLPFVMHLMSTQGAQKEKESKFLEFIRDLVEGVRTGTPINRSIVNLQDRDYGTLSINIKKLANQVNIGIPLDSALKIFAKDAKSAVISRSVVLISEAQKAGGDIGNILESVSSSVNQTEELKKEQKAAVSSLISQGYIIFLIFIVIMLVLQYSILPIALDFTSSGTVLSSNTGLSSQETTSLSVTEENSESFSTPLLILLVVQAIFAGLIIGKISEGKIMSGVKHSFILLAVTLLITTGARALL